MTKILFLPFLRARERGVERMRGTSIHIYIVAVTILIEGGRCFQCK